MLGIWLGAYTLHGMPRTCTNYDFGSPLTCPCLLRVVPDCSRRLRECVQRRKSSASAESAPAVGDRDTGRCQGTPYDILRAVWSKAPLAKSFVASKPGANRPCSSRPALNLANGTSSSTSMPLHLQPILRRRSRKLFFRPPCRHSLSAPAPMCAVLTSQAVC